MINAISHPFENFTGVSARIYKNSSVCDRRIIILPGGPGLKSDYLVEFSKSLSIVPSMEVWLLDFPTIEKNYLNYKNFLETLNFKLISSTINFNKNYFIGHSFGATMLADLVTNFSIRHDCAILMSLPAKLVASSEYSRIRNNLTTEQEMSNSEIFKKILPFLFHEKQETKTLKVIYDEFFLEAMPNITENFPLEKSIYANKYNQVFGDKVYCIQGANDIRLPDNNEKMLKQIIQKGNLKIIDKCGHYPMIEKLEETTSFCMKIIKQ